MAAVKHGGDRDALRLLGLARRAGRLVLGSRAVRGAARTGSLAAVLLARDASARARDRIGPLLEARGISMVHCADRASLGDAVGHSPLTVVGITDPAVAHAIVARLETPRR